MKCCKALKYEKFHRNVKIQKKVINSDNFAYGNIIAFIENNVVNRKNIYDIGCGVGTMDFYFASQGSNVIGIDISKRAINVANLNSKKFGLKNKVKFYRKNFPESNLVNKFELVIMSEVLEHLKDDLKALKTVSKNIKKRGKIIITVPSINAPLYRLGFLRKFDREVGHLRRYDKNLLIQLVDESGYRVERVELAEGILRNLLYTNKFFGILLKIVRGKVANMISSIDQFLIGFFGESNIYVIVSKK